jgi:hypothetical protein
MVSQTASRVRCGVAQVVLELGEERLDRVEVGRVLRQEQEFGASGPDGLPNNYALVAAEIVHDDDVAGLQRRSSLRTAG